MARQYVITEEEMKGLLDSLELHKLREDNICHPGKFLEEENRYLTQEERNTLKPAVDSLHRGFHLVVCRWADAMGFKDYYKR